MEMFEASSAVLDVPGGLRVNYATLLNFTGEGCWKQNSKGEKGLWFSTDIDTCQRAYIRR